MAERTTVSAKKAPAKNAAPAAKPAPAKKAAPAKKKGESTQARYVRRCKEKLLEKLSSTLHRHLGIDIDRYKDLSMTTRIKLCRDVVAEFSEEAEKMLKAEARKSSGK